eukprot:CCRYP_020781-RA/>CCRYP_020781-RA protein AED:0.34 eAED:0.34 QI:0/-1/0/1/-1/0/1/0/169
MDLTISISGSHLTTTLYEKQQNLYLYLPPHSSHPRGIESGLIFGQVLRIRCLFSNKTDADKNIKQFFQCLCERGPESSTLIPIFSRTESNAREYLRWKQNTNNTNTKTKGGTQKLFLHLQYHPEDPPSHEIQQLWRQHVAQPPNEQPLCNLENLDVYPFGPTRLIVAYS